MVINDIILNCQLKQIGETHKIFKELQKKDLKFWQDKLRKYFVDPHQVIVRGIPSDELTEKSREDEQKIIQERIDKFGVNGLKKRFEERAKAIEASHEVIN